LHPQMNLSRLCTWYRAHPIATTPIPKASRFANTGKRQVPNFLEITVLSRGRLELPKTKENRKQEGLVKPSCVLSLEHD